MKSDQKDEEIILDSEIDEFDIEEMTEMFRKWMISNRDRFLVDFENPKGKLKQGENCLLYTSPSPRDGLLSRMPSSA